MWCFCHSECANLENCNSFPNSFRIFATCRTIFRIISLHISIIVLLEHRVDVGMLNALHVVEIVTVTMPLVQNALSWPIRRCLHIGLKSGWKTQVFLWNETYHYFEKVVLWSLLATVVNLVQECPSDVLVWIRARVSTSISLITMEFTTRKFVSVHVTELQIALTSFSTSASSPLQPSGLRWLFHLLLFINFTPSTLNLRRLLTTSLVSSVGWQIMCSQVVLRWVMISRQIFDTSNHFLGTLSAILGRNALLENSRSYWAPWAGTRYWWSNAKKASGKLVGLLSVVSRTRYQYGGAMGGSTGTSQVCLIWFLSIPWPLLIKSSKKS